MIKDTIKKIKDSKFKIIVVGDIMLDHSVYGNVNRICPEAPVPVVFKKEDIYSLGGAGNVVTNLVALESRVDLITITGEDDGYKRISDLLSNISVNSSAIIFSNRPTTVKQRIFSYDHHQMIRIDSEETHDIDKNTVDTIISWFFKKIKDEDSKVVAISDYNKGLFTEDLCQQIIAESKRLNKITVVDPKGNNYEKYKNCDVIKPNQKELEDFVGHKMLSDEDIMESAFKMRDFVNCQTVIVTVGIQGVRYVHEDGYYRMPLKGVDVFDVTGAGDAFLAAFCSAIASDCGLWDSVYFANYYSSIYVTKPNTSEVLLSEIEKEIEKEIL